MVTLQIVSYEQCGKTALCAGIGKNLVNSGKKVAYIKPVHITHSEVQDDCSDSLFVNEALELGEDKGQVCPVHISQEDLWRKLTEDADGFSANVSQACNAVASGKDVLIIESPGGLRNDQVSTLAAVTITEKMSSKVILLLCDSTDFKDDDILQVAAKLGDKLVGVVINQVAESRVNAVQEEAAEYFKSKSIRLLGVLPEDRVLTGVSVEEVARAVSGEIISARDKASELIENVMLGAMSPDSGRDYFNRKKNKVVVTRAERADMQLAALETSTRCLIVSGRKPGSSVMVKAEDKKVPVMVVNKDTAEIIAGIEQALSKSKFRNVQKLQAMSSLLDSHFDYKTLYTALGV